MDAVGGIGRYEAAVSLRELILRRLEAEREQHGADRGRPAPAAAQPAAAAQAGEQDVRGARGAALDIYA